MSWVTVVWSMIAAACLTLAGVHLPFWIRNRAAWPSFFFSLMAMATAAYALCELRLLQALTPEEYAAALRWAHVPIYLVIVSLIGFVRSYLKAGRSWLAWGVIVLRSVFLLFNFVTGQSFNFREISAIHRTAFLGEQVSVALGTPNPWMLLGQAGACLLVVYLVDASFTAWRRGQRTGALSFGGSAIFFAAAGITQPILAFWGIVRSPITISLFFLGIIIVMAYELSRDVQRAAQLVSELRESEERMRLATDAAKLGIWVRDLERNELWVSPEARELFGFMPTEPLQLERLLQKIDPDDRAAFSQTLDKAAAGGGAYQTEFRITLPDGRTRWIAAQGRVEFDEQRRPIRTRGACSDISARKQSEQEALRLQQEIAHAGRVTVMGQLASALAHEINQPLGAILRNAEAASLLLQADPPDLDEIRAIVSDILGDDQRAGAVIDRMRAMLKRQDMEMRPLAVNEIVNEAVRLVRPDAAVRQVRLDLELAADLPLVMGDRIHLQQVLLNLIANGMDAIDEAGRSLRRIVVSARRAAEDKVEIAVSDSGAGIPPDRLGQIFKSFFTTKKTGMGMGLSISRSLIETHGGRLWAENCAVGGASLRFTLPVAMEESAT